MDHTSRFSLFGVTPSNPSATLPWRRASSIGCLGLRAKSQPRSERLKRYGGQTTQSLGCVRSRLCLYHPAAPRLYGAVQCGSVRDRAVEGGFVWLSMLCTDGVFQLTRVIPKNLATSCICVFCCMIRYGQPNSTIAVIVSWLRGVHLL